MQSGEVKKTVLVKSQEKSWKRPDRKSIVFLRGSSGEFANNAAAADASGLAAPTSASDAAPPLKIPFKQLGARFCPGLVRGIGTMGRGERARFSIAAGRYAERPNQSPSQPQDPDLEYEVELVDYWEVESLTKDDGIIMTTMRDTGAFDKPSEDCTVHVRYQLRTASGVLVDQSDPAGEPFAFVVGSGPLDAFDIGVCALATGDKALLEIRDPIYAYGSEGRPPHVGPNDCLELELELVSFIKAKPVFQQTIDEKLATMQRRKDEGNRLFARGSMRRAIQKYRAVPKVIHSTEALSREQAAARNAHLLAAHLNRAMALLNLNKFARARRQADAALALEPNSTKGLFRRAKACSALHEHDQALSDLRKLLQLEPDNKPAAAMAAKEAQLAAREREKAKAVYSKMFA